MTKAGETTKAWGFASKVSNSTHGSGWIVKFQPTGWTNEFYESHQRELVEVSLTA
jgi:glycine cleavage system H lipoate-binding protein